ncbi:uncharacterized protein LOC119766325 [Culex quinquefasciatus]|uniref:uncharacterized protein LOC119766325 n=1 Tax=Culex quinquefasciatus TaxID=7176 RepID=UPI0018E3F127|nr:uncharacterized protein LOC119766325 [Culex quinquefasciatus]
MLALTIVGNFRYRVECADFYPGFPLSSPEISSKLEVCVCEEVSLVRGLARDQFEGFASLALPAKQHQKEIERTSTTAPHRVWDKFDPAHATSPEETSRQHLVWRRFHPPTCWPGKPSSGQRNIIEVDRALVGRIGSVVRAVREHAVKNISSSSK